jgi:hypothetical protein
MFASIVALSTLLQTPNIQLPIDHVQSVDDAAVTAMSVGLRDLKGLLVSDDGKGIYKLGRDGIEFLGVEGYARPLEYVYYLRTSERKPLLYSTFARSIAEDNGAKNDWELPNIRSIVRAASDDSVTVAFHNDSGGVSGMCTVAIAGNSKSEPTIEYTSPQGMELRNAMSDLAGSLFINLEPAEDSKGKRGWYCDDKYLTDFQPGYSPIFFAKKSDLAVSYLYGESGFPFGFNIGPIANAGKGSPIPNTNRLKIVRLAWICPGKLIAYMEPSQEPDRVQSAGIYVIEADSWKRVSPHGLLGSSADGRVLLLSDLFLRKTWVATLKR